MTALAAPLVPGLDLPCPRPRLRVVPAPWPTPPSFERPAIARPAPPSAVRRARRSAGAGCGSRQRRAAVYRRRRVSVAVAGAALVVAGWQAIAPAAGPAAAGVTEAPPAPVAVHVVQDGDTLWSIARRHQPQGDVRPLVDRLARAHGSPALQVGDRVAIPG